MCKSSKKKIVIVGGGAGGLGLVAKLGNQFKRSQSIEITLIDKNLKHIWKPLFHEIAAGTFVDYNEEIDYISYAHQMGFEFVLGQINQINRIDKFITISPYYDNTKLILPERQITYDILILAVGSKINDFKIAGVTKHCLLLDSLSDAEKCNRVLLDHIILCTQGNIRKMNISIVGGGATGVELAAELNHVLTEAKKYGNKKNQNTYHFQVSVIEADHRVLNNLPERVSHSVSHYLQKNNIKIFTNTKIMAVKENGLITAEGKLMEADMMIWAAGVKGNTDSIKHDLEVNKVNQFLVKQTLQTSRDDCIFAFGDCASCPQLNKNGSVSFVPPRAQAAQQQANLLVKSISYYLSNKSLPLYHYRDYGSLISLSHYNVVGNLMGRVAKNLYIEGIFARFTYWLLYKRHLLTLKGIKYVVFSVILELFIKKQKPEIKLH